MADPETPRVCVRRMVADLWSKPGARDPAERVSQLLAGAPVSEIERSGAFVHVEGPDGYRGWMTEDDLAPCRKPEGEPRMIRVPYAFLYENPGAPCPRERVYMGTVVDALEAVGARRRIVLPEGARFVPEACLRPIKGPGDPLDIAGLLRDARRFLGVPYLWGGGTARGIDCSGFVQLLFRVQGRVLRRDARLQTAHGECVELAAVDPGDLIFFGRSPRGMPTHVGVALGGGECIHAEGGEVRRVRISPLAEAVAEGRVWGARRLR